MSRSEHRLGYVVKMYPRFSETFIVGELLAREAAGAQIEVFSLRPPTDGRFHESLAAVRAPIGYLRHAGVRAADLWACLGEAAAALPRLPDVLPDLLLADSDDAMQGLQLALLVRQRGISHLHAHFASVATTVARLASLLTGVPYSFTAHAKDLFHCEVDALELRRKLRDAHHVVTVSDYNLGWLQAQYGREAAMVHRVYNGLDLAGFPWTDPAPRARLVVAVGRLVEKKGFDVLVDAAALLRERGVAFRCILVGCGELEAALRAQIARLGLDDAVVMPGALPQGRVKALLSTAAAFAAPFVVGSDGNRDGLPTVLLEAMALGAPCVATPLTGIPEVVRDGVTGLVVSERDPSALADALAVLLDAPAMRCRLAVAARALIDASFDAGRQARELERLLPTRAPVPDITVQPTVGARRPSTVEVA